MEIGLHTTYEAITPYQRGRVEQPQKEADILPIPPENDKPQLDDEQKEKLQELLKETQQQKQEEKESLRKFVVGSTAIHSKQTQFEIYMSGMTGNEVDITNDYTILENLRDIQKQNDTIKAYATYKELAQKAENYIMV